jgi:hypothetical protein
VVGHDRLPDINDRAQLPYIDALCKEVVRWHVAVPLGMYLLARPIVLTMLIICFGEHKQPSRIARVTTTSMNVAEGWSHCLFRKTLSLSRISGTLVDPHIPQF